jgi:hypothetical protein
VVTLSVAITTTPAPESTPVLLTVLSVTVQTAMPQPGMELHPDQQQAYQEEQWAWIHARYVDIELRATQRHNKLIGKHVAFDTQLTKLHQCKDELEEEWAATINLTKAWALDGAVAAAINHEVPLRPTFARASQNMATAAALLDTLPAPSTDWVDRVYLQLKDIHGVAAKQQAEISLQWQTEVFVSSPGRSKASRQGTASKLPTVGTTSSSVQAQPMMRTSILQLQSFLP